MTSVRKAPRSLQSESFLCYILFLYILRKLSAIVASPVLIKQFLAGLAQRTGWSYTVLGGGPEPANGGKIRTIAVHEGQDKFGQIFSVAYPDFYEKVLTPFNHFMFNIYSTFFYFFLV